MRVLVAEDETLIRLDLCQMLERATLEVCAQATDGLQAIELAHSQQPDLVIIDVKMPRLDGIEAARRIVAARAVPVVVVSAYTERALVERAAHAGAYGYLAKPFKEADLFPAIATARARFKELTAAREEALELAEALAARKAIERAKGILMHKDGLTEQQAFTRLRKASQTSGRPMRLIAEALIDTLT